MKKVTLHIFDKLLSKESKTKLERVVFILAMAGFLIHLLVIGLVQIGQLDVDGSLIGLQNPIDAIYTPFSIILFYEVYCLIYYLPKSITIYIGKQFEIITLITIRDMFDEMSNLNLTSDLQMYSNPQFIYSMGTILILYLLIFLFYKQNQKGIRINNNTEGKMIRLPERKKKYLYAKQILALTVGVVFIILAFLNFYEWGTSNSFIDFLQYTKPVTRDFFSNFFMVLILSDVVVLLFSFAITDTFPKVMRNSGFVVSTTLIKLSFNVTGLASHILVIMSVIFGTLILFLYKRYKTIEVPND